MDICKRVHRQPLSKDECHDLRQIWMALKNRHWAVIIHYNKNHLPVSKCCGSWKRKLRIIGACHINIFYRRGFVMIASCFDFVVSACTGLRRRVIATICRVLVYRWEPVDRFRGTHQLLLWNCFTNSHAEHQDNFGRINWSQQKGRLENTRVTNESKTWPLLRIMHEYNKPTNNIVILRWPVTAL